MNSHARLTYDQVGAMLFDGDPALCRQHAKLLPHLNDLCTACSNCCTPRARRARCDRFRYRRDAFPL